MADCVGLFVSRCRFLAQFCLPSTVLVLAGCAPEVVRDPQEVRVDDASVFVSSESELLGRPADIAVGDDGSLYIVDMMASQVLVLSVDGLGQTTGRTVRPRVCDT
jgi:DNA-binding beta-propeller fold protein YncE